MSLQAHQTFQRQRFHQAIDSPAQVAHARLVLQLLLAQDGSTTRLCETIARGPVSLHMLEQRIVDSVPAEVSAALPGSGFIERITCLAAHGHVILDNLSYIALEGLPAELRRDLEQGVVPIGHLLSRLWARRLFIDAVPLLFERLWSVVGLSDPGASRSYCIVTPEGPRMLIAETYRRGVLIEHDAPTSV